MTSSTRRRFSSLTSGRSLSTRDTVLTLTPQSRAISLMVIGDPSGDSTENSETFPVTFSAC